MAQNIELTTAINTANSAKSLGELRSSLKELIALQGQVGAGSEHFSELADAINEAEGRVGDLQDSFQTLKGSGVERVNASLGLFREGLESADPEKLKIGLNGLKAAMSAIPILLLVEGFKYLVENWKEVLNFGKELFGMFSADEKAVKDLSAQLDLQKEATARLSKEYDREISLLEASGVSEAKVLQLKKQKIQAQIDEATVTAKLNLAKVVEARNNDTVTESLYKVQAALLRKIGQTKAAEALDKVVADSKLERTKDDVKAINDSVELIKDLKTSSAVEDVKFDKAQNDKYKKSLDDKNKAAQEAADYAYKRKLADQQAEDQAEDELSKMNDEKAKKEVADESAHNQILGDIYTAKTDKALADDKRLADQKKIDRAEQIQAGQTDLAIASDGVKSLQGLSDLVFAVKSANLKKGSKEEEAAARKQFQLNKALQIGSAVISGAQGVLTALTAPSTVPEPFGEILRVANAVAIGVTTAATIAKISATQFQSTGGASSSGSTPGGGASLGGSSGTTSTPALSNLSGQAFNPNTVGKIGLPGSGSNQQKVVVVESDITRAQNKVNVIETGSKFG